jgi:hypothetical protein
MPVTHLRHGEVAIGPRDSKPAPPTVPLLDLIYRKVGRKAPSASVEESIIRVVIAQFDVIVVVDDQSVARHREQTNHRGNTRVDRAAGLDSIDCRARDRRSLRKNSLAQLGLSPSRPDQSIDVHSVTMPDHRRRREGKPQSVDSAH